MRGLFVAASTDDVNLASRRLVLGYGKHWFSVQAEACTETTSFPYTPLGHYLSHPKFGLKMA